MRTPAALPRIQNEPVVRVLAADLVDPGAVLEGLAALAPEIDAAAAQVAEGRAVQRELPPERAALLEAQGAITSLPSLPPAAKRS